MSLGTLLQTIIAVIFIYLILSLLASEIQEYIASIAEFRAKSLKESIKQFLGEKSQSNENSLTELLYENPLIRSLNQSGTNITSKFFKSKGPSYIDPKLFSLAVLEVIKDKSKVPNKEENKLEESDNIDRLINRLTQNNLGESTLLQIAQSLKLEQDNSNLSHFRAKIEDLFKEVQERSSGVYKRNAKGLSFVLGLLIAIIINVDAFYIVSNLSKDNNEFREQIANELYENSSILAPDESTPDDFDQNHKKIIKEIFDEAAIDTIPLGWNRKINWTTVIPGWIISAIAISMGAPFWFDLLGKVMNVRNTKKTEKTDSQED